jgi:hypothetical protein
MRCLRPCICYGPSSFWSSGDFEPCPEGWDHIGSLHAHCYGSQYEALFRRSVNTFLWVLVCFCKGVCRPLISTAELSRIGQDVFAHVVRCG